MAAGACPHARSAHAGSAKPCSLLRPGERDFLNTAGILIVVVLYRAAEAGLVASALPLTLRCLASAFAEQPAFTGAYRLLVWDNSPQPVDLPLSLPFRYHHAAVNNGVSGAYNGALETALSEGYAWMLLLDDDTAVSVAYLDGMVQHRAHLETETETVAAVAPLLYDKDFQLSPQQVLTHRQKPVAPSPSRILEGETYAANSGVMLRVSALAQVGGYSLDFWLDYSDIELFHRLHLAGKRLFLAADLKLQHSMTMLDYDARMTPARYSNFLAAEQAFFDLYKTPAQHAVQVLRLMARVVRQRRYRSREFSRLTLRALLRRLRTTRRQRMHAWKQRTLARQVPPSCESEA